MRFRAIRAGVAVAAVAAMTALGGGEALARAKVGVLTCNVAPGIGLIVGSSKSLSCSFNPSAPGPNERYSGRISRVGVDVGITGSGVIVWGVFAPESGVLHARRARRSLRRSLGAGDARGGPRRQRARRRWQAVLRAAAVQRHRPDRRQLCHRHHRAHPLRALASPRAASPSISKGSPVIAPARHRRAFRVFGTPAKRSCQPGGSLRPSPERRPGHLDCGGVEGTIEGRHRRWETAMAE